MALQEPKIGLGPEAEDHRPTLGTGRVEPIERQEAAGVALRVAGPILIR